MAHIKNTPLMIFVKKWHVSIILFLIVALGAYLRLSDFEDLARFNSDQVRDTQIVTAMVEEKEFPLLGPKAGGTKFKLGPAFYYLEYTSAHIFGATPTGIGVLTPILGTVSIVLFFYLMRFYFLPHLSLLLTFLYAISFYAIRYTRFAWNPNVIPFFLFAYLIAILQIAQPKKKHLLLWYSIVGITIGIGTQLHTTLLILMPAIFICTQIYLYIKNRSVSVRHILAAVVIALFLHAPAIMYDIQNNGANLKEFFRGTQTKTEESMNLITRIGKTGQFFSQGSTYTLTGIEPRKNWLNAKKLVHKKEFGEIALAVISTAFFVAGVFLLFKNLRTEKNPQRKNFLLLTATTLVLTFCLFFLIAGELNLRFFITVIFLPFILFGIITQKILAHHRKTLLPLAVIIFTVALIATPNFLTYKKAYDFSDLTVRESLYGGISIGESKEIAQFITHTSTTPAHDVKYLLPFDRARSVKFFIEKNGDEVSRIKPHEAPSDSPLFLITKNKKGFELPQKYADCFSVQDNHQLKRFSVFVLQREKHGCFTE